jgi:uncharacterized protein (DUF3820 family)
MNPDDLLKLVTIAMPYGKYKGRLLADLPGQYLNWFAREGFPNGELECASRTLTWCELTAFGACALSRPLTPHSSVHRFAACALA